MLNTELQKLTKFRISATPNGSTPHSSKELSNSYWWIVVSKQSHLLLLLVMCVAVLVVVMAISLMGAIHCLTSMSEEVQVNSTRNITSVSMDVEEKRREWVL